MTTGSLLQMSGIVVDLIYRIDRRPEPGGEAEAREVLIAAGGGFNAMIAAKRFGATVAYGGAIGSGLFAQIAERALEGAGVPIKARRRHPFDQGTCVVLVESNGERTFYSHHGAERWPDRDDLVRLGNAQYDWVLLTGYSLIKDSSASALLPWLETLPGATTFLFDPAPIIGDVSPTRMAVAMRRADWVSANSREAAAMTGMDNPAASAARLASGRRGAVVRHGAEGCWLSVAGAPAEHLPGAAVEAVDTSGAGDTHVGTFIGALCRGHDPRTAARVANCAAAIKTTRFGPATSPDFQETLDFMRSRGVDMPL